MESNFVFATAGGAGAGATGAATGASALPRGQYLLLGFNLTKL